MFLFLFFFALHIFWYLSSLHTYFCFCIFAMPCNNTWKHMSRQQIWLACWLADCSRATALRLLWHCCLLVVVALKAGYCVLFLLFCCCLALENFCAYVSKCKCAQLSKALQSKLLREWEANIAAVVCRHTYM